MNQSISRIAFVILFLLCLSGCTSQMDTITGYFSSGSPLTIIDKNSFKDFAHAFTAELAEKDIVDSKGMANVVESSAQDVFVPESYGKELYKRLSMQFMWSKEEREQSTQHLTHSDIPSKGERVISGKHGLEIINEFGSDSYHLVALLDWNKDDKRDWLIRYTHISAIDSERRERLIVAPAPDNSGIIDAIVIQATECYGKKCTTYQGNTLIKLLGYTPTM